jgi:hypothetical protein
MCLSNKYNVFIISINLLIFNFFNTFLIIVIEDAINNLSLEKLPPGCNVIFDCIVVGRSFKTLARPLSRNV